MHQNDQITTKMGKISYKIIKQRGKNTDFGGKID